MFSIYKTSFFKDVHFPMNTPQSLSITSKYILLILGNKMDPLKLFPPTNFKAQTQKRHRRKAICNSPSMFMIGKDTV